MSGQPAGGSTVRTSAVPGAPRPPWAQSSQQAASPEASVPQADTPSMPLTSEASDPRPSAPAGDATLEPPNSQPAQSKKAKKPAPARSAKPQRVKWADRTAPEGARLPRSGWQRLWYWYLVQCDRRDLVPRVNKRDAAYYDGLDESAEQLDKFNELGDQINQIVRGLGGKCAIMVVNQAGKASKTWTTTWLSSELADTTRYNVAVLEMRDGTAFGTDILGIPEGNTLSTQQLLERDDDVRNGGNLDYIASRNRYGVIGITTRSLKTGDRMTMTEAAKVLDIAQHNVSFMFIDTGNTPVSEVNLAACEAADVFILVSTPHLVAAKNLSQTVKELAGQGIKFTADNAFAMFNNWRTEPPEEWRTKLDIGDDLDLLGTEHDPGADDGKLSEGLGTEFEDLQVNFDNIKIKTRISLRRALIKILELRTAQLTAEQSRTSRASMVPEPHDPVSSSHPGS